MGVVMQVRNIVFLLSIFSMLAGCNVFSNRQVDYKAGAVAVQPLEVPPDLVAPAVSSQASLPAADGTQAANYSDFVRAPKAAETPCTAPASGTVAPPRLLQAGLTRFILLAEPFDRAWRTVGLALDRAGIKPSDLDRSKGMYFLKLSGKEKSPSEAQLHVVETAGVSVVTVEGMAQQDAATRLLESLHQRMVQ
ncbi:MAG: hypothetical protein Fur0026_09360 [Sideroxydans sp.]